MSYNRPIIISDDEDEDDYKRFLTFPPTPPEEPEVIIIPDSPPTDPYVDYLLEQTDDPYMIDKLYEYITQPRPSHRPPPRRPPPPSPRVAEPILFPIPEDTDIPILPLPPLLPDLSSAVYDLAETANIKRSRAGEPLLSIPLLLSNPNLEQVIYELEQDILRLEDEYYEALMRGQRGQKRRSHSPY